MIERLEQQVRKADERGKKRVKIRRWDLQTMLITIEQLQKQVADLRVVYETFDAQRDLARGPTVESNERLVNALRQLAQTRSQLDQYEAWAKEERDNLTDIWQRWFEYGGSPEIAEDIKSLILRCPIQVEKETDQ